MGTKPHLDLVNTGLHPSKEAPNLFAYGGLQVWSSGTSSQPDGISDEGTPTVVRDTGERDNWFSTPYSVKYTASGAANEGGKITFSNLKANTKYGVHVRAKATGGDTARMFTVGAATEIDNETLLSVWTDLYGTFTTDGTPTNVVLKLVAKTDGDIVWFGQIMIVEGDVIPTFAPQPSGSEFPNVGPYDSVTMNDGGTIGCSGGMELQFDCGNSILTLQGGQFYIRQSLASLTAAPLDVKNEEDQADVLVANFRGPDRATAVNDDSGYIKFWNDDDAGVQQNTSFFRWYITDVTGTTGQFEIGTSGSSRVRVDDEGFWLLNNLLQSTGGPVKIQNKSIDTAITNVMWIMGTDRGTAVDGDNAYVSFKLDDSIGVQAEFVRFRWTAIDVSTASLYAAAKFELMQNSVFRDYMTLTTNLGADSGAIIFNDEGQNIDYRVEGSGVSTALFVRGSDGKVGIWTSSPGAVFTVGMGRAQFTGNTAPSSGAGVEVGYTGTVGLIVAYDRTGTAYKQLDYYALSHVFRISGVEKMKIDTGGEVYMPAVYDDAVGGTNRDLYIDNTGKLGRVASSIFYKENVRYDFDTSWIYALKPAMVDMKDGSVKDEICLIAEDVNLINKRLVSYKRTSWGNGQYSETSIPESVNYSRLISPILAELQKVNIRLKRVEELV